MFGLEFVAGVMAGILLIGIGGHRILTLLGVRIPNLPGITFFSRMLASGQLAISRWLPGTRALAMGLFSALLPCGWLYAFVAVAVGTGQVFAGVAVLFVFWLGTVPLLAGLGAGLGPLLARTGRVIQIATASLIIFLGVVSIAGRWNLSPSRAMAGPIVDQHTAVPPEPTCHH
jgi:sulfite exporter TauE/SafE